MSLAERLTLRLEDDDDQAVEASAALRDFAMAVHELDVGGDAFDEALALSNKISDPWCRSDCVAALAAQLQILSVERAWETLDDSLAIACGSLDQSVTAVGEFAAKQAREAGISEAAVGAWLAINRDQSQ
jgi:hypothetical protein